MESFTDSESSENVYHCVMCEENFNAEENYIYNLFGNYICLVCVELIKMII
jgi:hypothetical protein